ncbi:hypothetical protein BDW22DRAFT_1427444 [Trametopsis cervina]|nr:hypothetical protein BDW22DRAFT_1427444 [Trametopsis cervina]
MLASTPTSEYAAYRPSRRDPSLSPSFTHRTPPRPPVFRRPMHSPSPLKRHALPTASLDDDDVFSSPAQKAFAQKENTPRRRSSLFNEDDDGLFLAPPSSAQSHSFFPPSSSPMPLRTPVKTTPNVFETPSRPALSIRATNTATTGTKRKTNTLPVNTPDKCVLTPLNITASSGNDSFGFNRLAPLPAPRFGTRTPQTRADTEQYLKSQEDSMGKLKLGGRDQSGEESGYDSGFDVEKERGKRPFIASSTVKGKGRKSPIRALLVGKALDMAKDEEVAESISPSGHVNKRRARSRPVSTELLRTMASTPASGNKVQYVPTPHLSATKSSGSVAFPSFTNARGRRISASSSSSVEIGSPRRRTRVPSAAAARTRTQSQHHRAPLNRLTSQSSATLFFGPSIPQTEARPKKCSTDAMSIDVPSPLLLSGRPQFRARHSYAGEPWRSPKSSDEMDEADLFFSSPPANSSFVFNLTSGTPSPTKKRRIEPVEMLPKKYRPRDSGVVLNDSDDDLFERPHSSNPGVGLFANSAGQGSSSFSSLQSESDFEALVTPGFGPGPNSGWPAVGVVNLDDDCGVVDVAGLDNSDGADAFILRTLTAGKKSSGSGGEPKRAPGTPVKKVKTSHLIERPWQSAVAHKIGFPEFDAMKGNAGGKENKKSKPRQSLPAAFPMLGSARQRRDARAGGSSVDLDNEDEEASPTTRKETTYGGLGLGRPPVPAFPKTCDPKSRTRWMMRRTSSGAFSSGSETSRNATPTRLLAKDWNAHIVGQRSPLVSASPTDTRSNTTSATASPTITSPTLEAIARQVNTPGATSPKKTLINPSAQRAAKARANVFPGSAIRGRISVPSPEERPGRFEHEFIEIDELGRGEFGRVMKVRYKEGSREVFAVKKSKRFEGVKHRLRLREEVDILKHLSRAAGRAGLGLRHPNVLGYIDSWEEDETLFIQTELCSLGNFSHLLWEYGRAFPRLDEARVWKIFAELSAGMRFIHDADVIHLDLKPANIFITSEGRFKIGDFGMASIWPRPSLTDATNAGGKASFEREGDKLYLAPEVLQGRYSKAADIFSLGMTILETATNVIVPDQGDAWHRIRHEDFTQVDMSVLSTELVELIKSMLRTDPSLRVDAGTAYIHPVIMRARVSMELARETLGATFQASALAGAPPGWLESILGRSDEWDGNEDDESMDLSP